MKSNSHHFFLFILFTLFFVKNVHAQWTDWVKVAGVGNGAVYISFKITTCTNSNLNGWSFYRIKNTCTNLLKAGCSGSFKFSYHDCDGKVGTDGPNVIHLDHAYIDQDRGNWFSGHDVIEQIIPGSWTLSDCKDEASQNGESEPKNQKLDFHLRRQGGSSGVRGENNSNDNGTLIASNELKQSTLEEKRNQQQTDTYLNNAANSSDEIEKQKNLSLAQINTLKPGGSIQQRQEIQHIQQNENEKSIDNLINILTSSPDAKSKQTATTSDSQLEEKAKEIEDQLKAEERDEEKEQAIFNQGHKYYYGEGVSVDYRHAFNCFQKGADRGDIDAMYMLGTMYYEGNGVALDYKQALHWYHKATEYGDIQQSYGNALYMLGEIYYYGHGVSADYNQAFHWYQKAADNNNVGGMYMLGAMYYYGNELQRDYEQALLYFQKAADRGNFQAARMLGQMFNFGFGVPEDNKQGLYWTQKAIDGGDSDAMVMMGVMYLNGKGVTLDKKQALFWYQKLPTVETLKQWI